MEKNNSYIYYRTLRLQKRGSVMLLTLILTTILISIGMGISGIAMKEIRLSSIGTESGLAFYAADTGVECALFWDIQRPFAIGSGHNKTNGTFATSSDSIPWNLTPISGIDCPTWGFDIATRGDPSSQMGITYISNSGLTQPHWMLELGSDSFFDYATTTFLMPYIFFLTPMAVIDPFSPCAIVEVAKKSDRTTHALITTTIDSHGRSSCDSNPRRVERGLHVSY